MITFCDTGPLVALLREDDRYHTWCHEVARQFRATLITCEAVLTEAFYFLRDADGGCELLFKLLEQGFVRIDFDLDQAWPRVRTLMQRYDQMDLADACLVVMTEQHKRCQVWTLDRKDFSVYRRNDRQVIPFIAPPK